MSLFSNIMDLIALILYVAISLGKKKYLFQILLFASGK